jgi:hypothetical protein
LFQNPKINTAIPAITCTWYATLFQINFELNEPWRRQKRIDTKKKVKAETDEGKQKLENL